MINFYKFKNIDNSYISNFWIDILNNEYQKYNFIAIEKHINEINKSFFLSSHTKKIINDTYYCNLKLKRLIEKIKAKYIKYKKNIHPINDTYLNFENIETDVDKTLYIDINTRKKNNFYRLHINEIIKLFKVSLLNHVEGFPNPYIPSNPYTGITFNLSEIIYIFTSMKYNSSLPIELILFKNCSFNIDRLLENHKNHFVLQASISYINELDDIQWNNILKEWYKNNRIKKIACWKCLNEIPNLRNLIKNIIIKYIFESNVLTYINQSTEMFKIFAQNYNLEPSHKHFLKHNDLFNKKSFHFNIENNINIKFFDYDSNYNLFNNNIFVFNSEKNTKSSKKYLSTKNRQSKIKKKKYYKSNTIKTFDLFKNNKEIFQSISQIPIETNLFPQNNLNEEYSSIINNNDIIENSNEPCKMLIDNINNDLNEINLNEESNNVAESLTSVINNNNVSENSIENNSNETSLMFIDNIIDNIIENSSQNNSNEPYQMFISNILESSSLNNLNEENTELIDDEININHIISVTNENNIDFDINVPELEVVIENNNNSENLSLNDTQNSISKNINYEVNKIIMETEFLKNNIIPVYKKLWNGKFLCINKKNYKIYSPSNNQYQILGKLYLDQITGVSEQNINFFIEHMDTIGIWNIDTNEPDFYEPGIEI